MSSDIASPVQPTQNRWSLTSAQVCFVEAVTVQSGAEGKIRAHEDVAILRIFIESLTVIFSKLATLSPAQICNFPTLNISTLNQASVAEICLTAQLLSINKKWFLFRV